MHPSMVMRQECSIGTGSSVPWTLHGWGLRWMGTTHALCGRGTPAVPTVSRQHSAACMASTITAYLAVLGMHAGLCPCRQPGKIRSGRAMTAAYLADPSCAADWGQVQNTAAPSRPITAHGWLVQLAVQAPLLSITMSTKAIEPLGQHGGRATCMTSVQAWLGWRCRTVQCWACPAMHCLLNAGPLPMDSAGVECRAKGQQVCITGVLFAGPG